MSSKRSLLSCDWSIFAGDRIRRVLFTKRGGKPLTLINKVTKSRLVASTYLGLQADVPWFEREGSLRASVANFSSALCYRVLIWSGTLGPLNRCPSLQQF